MLLQNLLQEMARQTADSDEITLITMNGVTIPTLFGQERRIETYRLARPNRFNWIADHFLLPGLARRSGADIFFATDFNSYLEQTETTLVVSMVYDVIPFIFPETMAVQPWSVRIGWRTNFPKLHKSDVIIAISEATKQDVISIFGVSPERIRVIYPGIDHELFNLDNAGHQQRREDLFQRYGINERFFLYVGDSEWRKNLRRCLEAFAGVDRNIKLVLVGKKAKTDVTLLNWIDSLGLAKRVILTGFVPDADLPLFYGAAEAFLFPSIYEGFGLPVAEAMACGCPVITSSVSAMPEVAGNAGILINPSSVADIRNAMLQITNDAALRQQMQKAGLLQAQKFNWGSTAKATMELMHEVAAR